MKKNVLIIIGAVIIIAAALGFVFRNSIMKTIAPAKYVMSAIDKTNENLLTDVLEFPTWEREGMYETGFSINLRNLETEALEENDKIIDMLKLANISGTAKVDRENRKMHTSLSVGASGFTVGEGELYISDDMYAIKTPFYDMPISINPNSFFADWNGSFYGQLLGTFLEDSLHGEYITDWVFSDKSFAAVQGETQTQNIGEYFRSGQVEYSGTSTIVVGGTEKKLDVATVKLEGLGLKSLYDSSVQHFIDKLEAQLESVIMLSQFYDETDVITQWLDETKKQLEDFQVIADFEIKFYIDTNNLIRRIDIPQINIDANDNQMQLNIQMDLMGEKKVADRSVITVELSGDRSLNAEIEINQEDSSDRKIAREISINSRYDGDEANLVYKINWAPDKAEDITVYYLAENKDNKMEFILEGDLKDTETELSFTNGLTALELNDEYVELRVGFSIRECEEMDVEKIENSAVSLFDINIIEVMKIIGSITEQVN